MSQVRKFQNSGKIEVPELFERKGVGKYNKKDIISNLYTGIDNYIKDNNLSDDISNSFRSSANRMIEGIKNGTITMNGDGSLSDSTGSLQSNGKNEFDWLGRLKNNTNNINNLAAGYISKIIGNSSPYIEEVKPANKQKFNIDTVLENEIAKKYFGGNSNVNPAVWITYDKVDDKGIRSTANRSKIVSDILGNLNYNDLSKNYDISGLGIKDENDWKNRISQLTSKLNDGILNDEDYLLYAQFGGNDRLKMLLGNEVKQPDSQPDSQNPTSLGDQELAKKAAEITKKEEIEKENKTNKETIDNYERDQYFKNFQVTNPFKQSHLGAQLPNIESTLNRELLEKQKWYPQQGTRTQKLIQFFNNALNRAYFDQNTNGKYDQHLINNIGYFMDTLSDSSKNLYRTSQGDFVLPQTIDTNSWTGYAWNPSSKSYREVSLLSDNALQNLRNFYYKNKNKKYQQGGQMNYQNINDIIESDLNIYNQQQDQNKLQKQQETQQSTKNPKKENRTKQEKDYYDKPVDLNNLTKSEIAELGSLGLDLASMVSAFVPGAGTVTSAVTGAGSSLLTYGNKVANTGFNLKDLGELGMNLGLDTVGLIPGIGAGAKGTKMLKFLVKWTPRILTTLAAKEGIENFDEIKNSFGKALKGDFSKLTMQDYQNMAQGIKLVSGIGHVGSDIKKSRLRTAAEDSNFVIHNNGERTVVTPKQLEDIRGYKTLKDQNEYLQLLTGNKNFNLSNKVTDNRWFNYLNREWLGDTNVSKNYDFNGIMKNNGKSLDMSDRMATDYTNIMPTKTQILKNITNPKTANINIWDMIKYPSYKRINSHINDVRPSRSVMNDREIVYKSGGRLKFQSGGITPILQNNNDWYNQNYLQYRDDLANDLTSTREVGNGLIDGDNRLMQLNSAQNNHYNLYNNWKNKKVAYTSPEVKDYQNNIIGTFGYVNNKGIKNALLNDRYNISTNANTSDNLLNKWVPDGYYSGFTDDRRILGRAGDFNTEQLKNEQSYWGNKGFSLFLNPKTKYYQLERKLNNGLVLSSPNIPSKLNNPLFDRLLKLANSTNIIGNNRNSKSNFINSFTIKPEDTIALTKMLMGLNTNNKTTELYKRNLKPILDSTSENVVPIQGNLLAKSQASEQAANIASLASKPRTSDSTLQLAGELESAIKSNQLIQQGNLQDADMFYKTRMANQQESDAAKARRNQTSFENSSRMQQIQQAKNNIDAGRLSANYSQIINPYLSNIENNYALRRGMRQQYDFEVLNKATMASMQDEYDAALKRGDIAAKNRIIKEWQDKMMKAKGNLLDYTPLFQKKFTKGGTLTSSDRKQIESAKDFNKRLLEDNQQFHKNIMDSIKENNKMLLSLSSFTRDLIKNAMT